jgi:hypothetical protein
MSKTGEQGKIPPPPLNKDDNPIVVEDDSNTETSMVPTMEELMKQLEKLNAEVKRLKANYKKGKKHSFSSDDDDKRSYKPYKKKSYGEAHIGKNRNPMMIVPTLIVIMWQPLLSREYLLQASISS